MAGLLKDRLLGSVRKVLHRGFLQGYVKELTEIRMVLEFNLRGIIMISVILYFPFPCVLIKKKYIYIKRLHGKGKYQSRDNTKIGEERGNLPKT